MRHTKRTMTMLMAGAILLVGSTACDSLVYEDLDPCPQGGLRLPFRYDMNMKFADAFANEVRAVDLYIYDSGENLVGVQTARGDSLRTEGFQMHLDALAPGDYHLVAWAFGDNEGGDFVHSGASSQPGELHYTLPTSTDELGAYSGTDLKRLYHARQKVTVPAHDTEIVTLPPMRLTKDTNVVRILLQHLDGSQIDHEDFDFAVSENFTRLDHTNLPADYAPITYRAWDKQTGQAGTPSPDGDGMQTVSTLIAEVTTSRLMTPEFSQNHFNANSGATRAASDDKPYLSITSRNDGRTVVRIPLTDYLLMVKGNYNRSMDDQEYLDRQDDYTLHFFLDQHNNWYTAAGIYVNSWHVVPQDTDL